jgi:hypothetical protein
VARHFLYSSIALFLLAGSGIARADAVAASGAGALSSGPCCRVDFTIHIPVVLRVATLTAQQAGAGSLRAHTNAGTVAGWLEGRETASLEANALVKRRSNLVIGQDAVSSEPARRVTFAVP